MKFKTGNYINPKKIATKYELTHIDEDEDFMHSMFRGILKDTSPDKPTREYEAPRKSSEVNGVLDRRYGRKTDDDVNMPDLFLGDLSKDPRSIMSGPDLNGIRKFMEHRKDAYAVNALNDDDKRIQSKTMTHAEVRRAKDKTFYRVKDKYSHFEEQTDQGVRSVAVFDKTRSDLAKVEHKSSYKNREFEGKKSHKQSTFTNISDYTIKKTNSKEAQAPKHRKDKVDLRMQETAHKTQEAKTSEITKAHVLTLSNFIDRKLESLDDYKLTANLKDSKDQTTKSQREVVPTRADAEVHSSASKELLLCNRLSRNVELFNEIKSNPNALTHKSKLRELLGKTSKTARMQSMNERNSLVTPAKTNEVASSLKTQAAMTNESRVNKSSVFAKQSAPLLIYNYKSRRPERVQPHEASRKSDVSTYALKTNANHASVTKYDQIRESHKEEVEHADISANRVAGQSGPIGSKYLRPSMIFKEEDQSPQLVSDLRASNYAKSL